jgi:hypothetical protein
MMPSLRTGSRHRTVAADRPLRRAYSRSHRKDHPSVGDPVIPRERDWVISWAAWDVNRGSSTRKDASALTEDSTTPRSCGRPTKSGDACRARIYGSDVACSRHITDAERKSAEAYRRGYSAGYQQGLHSEEGAERLTIEHLERRIRDLEQRLDQAERYYELDGHQVVEVGRYAYRWRGSSPLSVGDRVVLPENWLSRVKDGPGSREAVVTKLGTRYRGELSFIVRRAE